MANLTELQSAIDQACEGSCFKKIDVTRVSDKIKLGVRFDEDFLLDKYRIKRNKWELQGDLFYISDGEPEYFYKDIFMNESYLGDWLELPEGATIFDVGSNVGYFSMFVNAKLKNYTLYSFEPAPHLYKALALNCLNQGIRANIYNCGLLDHTDVKSFTFYKNSSGLSSFYGDQEEEEQMLRAMLTEDLRRENIEEFDIVLDELTRYRLESEQMSIPTLRLSDFISQNGIKNIDLLKIDAEKSEYEILRGVDEEHFEIINQIVVEVHDIDDKLQKVKSILEPGFDLKIMKDENYKENVMYTVYAKKSKLRKLKTMHSTNDINNLFLKLLEDEENNELSNLIVDSGVDFSVTVY